MTGITNNYEKILKEMIFNQFSENFKQKLIKSNNINKKDKLTINQKQSNMDILNKNRNTNPYAINYLYSRINSQ